MHACINKGASSAKASANVIATVRRDDGSKEMSGTEKCITESDKVGYDEGNRTIRDAGSGGLLSSNISKTDHANNDAVPSLHSRLTVPDYGSNDVPLVTSTGNSVATGHASKKGPIVQSRDNVIYLGDGPRDMHAESSDDPRASNDHEVNPRTYSKSSF